MNSQDIFAIAAIAGVIFHLFIAYREKQKENPDIRFDYTYIIAAMGAVGVIAAYFQSQPTTEITILSVLIAFTFGFGMDSTLAFVNGHAPILKNIKLESD